MARSDSPIRGFVIEVVDSVCMTSVKVLVIFTSPVAVNVAVLPMIA